MATILTFMIDVTFLFGNSEWKSPLRRPAHSWKDNTKMDFTEIMCDDLKWIYLAQDRVQWRAFAYMVNVSSGSIKCRGPLD
jgi:hypothetical protein